MAAPVEIVDLVVTHAGRNVVDHLSLTAPERAITVVLGPNGAGKTTTIETAEGLRRPHGGIVRVLGLDPAVDGASLRPSVGVMLQSGGTWPSLRVRDVVAHAARLYAAAHPVDPLLDRVGLASAARTPYRRLSGGEQRKVGLACALVGRPVLVFLDEPTTGLDPQSRADVWQLLADLRAGGVTVVMTTHLLDEADALADEVVVISQGRVAAAGTLADVAASGPGLRFRARPGLDLADLATHLPHASHLAEPSPGHYRVDGPVDPDLVATVTTWCAARGAMPAELRTTGGSLTEAYFDLTTGRTPPEGPTPQVGP